MRGALLISVIISLGIVGILHKKRSEAVPAQIAGVALVDADGKPIKHLHEMPNAVRNQLGKFTALEERNAAAAEPAE